MAARQQRRVFRTGSSSGSPWKDPSFSRCYPPRSIFQCCIHPVQARTYPERVTSRFPVVSFCILTADLPWSSSWQTDSMIECRCQGVTCLGVREHLVDKKCGDLPHWVNYVIFSSWNFNSDDCQHKGKTCSRQVDLRR